MGKEYLDMNVEVPIKCKKHNVYFLVTPQQHLDGNGCPVCDGIVSERTFADMKSKMKKGDYAFHIREECQKWHLYYIVFNRKNKTYTLKQ
jgi:hypothetical protein